MNTEDRTYDHIGEFHQGIAIVEKGGKYGAIMVGGKEIISPIYDELSVFDNGLATVRFNDEERTINMLGQILVKKEGDEIFLPEEYDWGYDFTNDFCVVFKKGHGYGMISYPNESILEPIYSSFLRLENGSIVFYTPLNKSRLVYTDGEVFFIRQSVSDVCYVISDKPYSGHVGVTNNLGHIVIPIEYSRIDIINNAYIVADTENKTKLFNIRGELLRDSNTKVKYFPISDAIGFEHLGERFHIDENGELFLISGLKRIHVTEKYLNYRHEHFYETREIVKAQNEDKLWGISDFNGNILVPLKYNYITPLGLQKDLFIAALSEIVGETEYLKFGIIDINDKCLLPFKYGCLISVSNDYIAYSLDFKRWKENDNVYGFGVPQKGGVSTSHWGIIDSNLNEICSPQYNILEKIQNKDLFLVYKNGGYGIVNNVGDEIVPTKYKDISYSANGTYGLIIMATMKDCFFPIHLDENGYIIVSISVNEKMLVPSSLFDWCGDFDKGKNYAKVLKNGCWGKIDKHCKLVSLLDDKLVEVPSKYEFAQDFHNGYVSVMINNKWGIADINFDMVIPCIYEAIETLGFDTFKYTEKGKLGIVDCNGHTIVTADYDNITLVTQDLFKVSKGENKVGIIDKKGNIIVPMDYCNIDSVNIGNDIFWIIKQKEVRYNYRFYGDDLRIDKTGIYWDGKIIIPLLYIDIIFEDEYFVCTAFTHRSNNDIVKVVIKYTPNGEIVLKYCNGDIFVSNDYEMALDASLGLFRVMKNGKWGLISIANDIVLEPQFDYISKFKHSFAIVGQAENTKDAPVEYFLDNKDYYSNMKYGLVDTSGEIVLPIEYSYIKRLDNDYFLVQNKLLSPSLNVVVELNYGIWDLDNRFFIVKGESSYSRAMYNLIDFFGNEVVKGFEKIEVIGDNLLKATFFRSDLDGASYIGILNNQGKVLYESHNCDDISYIGNGLLRVKSFKYTSDSAGFYVYNLANLQGKELFNRYYKNIEIQENGDIFVEAAGRKSWDTTWGMANAKGELIIAPKYEDELIFKDGFSEIRVKGCNEKRQINKKGNVAVLDSKGGTILIPKDYYWASNFVKGCSLVRSKDGDNIGVINKNGRIIIEAKYDEISIFSNNTIQVRDSNLYGICNLKGECIFPTIFTSIKYLGNNRLRVAWNISFAASWERGSYSPGEAKYVSANSFDENYRSALCDSNGNVLNGKEIVWIGKCNGKYAISYGKIEKCNSKYVSYFSAELSQAGIVDIDGNTIVSPEYDKIRLYDHSYALLEKSSKFGIVDLAQKRITTFNDININHAWDVDAHGRFIYTDNGTREFDEDEGYESWTGDVGVLGMEGIVVPTGKYQRITLLENGLIEVFNDGLFGLLDLNGKELLPVKYSYISSFRGNYAAICLNGHNEERGGGDHYKYSVHVGGKWGIIGCNGDFFKECVSDERLELPKFEDEKEDSIEPSVCELPHILLSDKTQPIEVEFYSGDSYDYYDDGCSKYGGYNGYDDDTIDSAFEGDPELTWNID